MRARFDELKVCDDSSYFIKFRAVSDDASADDWANVSIVVKIPRFAGQSMAELLELGKTRASEVVGALTFTG